MRHSMVECQKGGTSRIPVRATLWCRVHCHSGYKVSNVIYTASDSSASTITLSQSTSRSRALSRLQIFHHSAQRRLLWLRRQRRAARMRRGRRW